MNGMDMSREEEMNLFSAARKMWSCGTDMLRRRPHQSTDPEHTVNTTNEVSNPPMDQQIRKACITGDLNLCKHLILRNPDMLLSLNPLGNNCLHLAAMLGHEKLAELIWSSAPSLFSGTNNDGETPLMAAIMAANAELSANMLTAASRHLQSDLEEGKPLNEMLLKVDVQHGDNVLHHAIRNGFEDLAVRLLDVEPRLSEQVNQTAESPMFMAARKRFAKVVERLLKIPSSADSGPAKYTALHAAVSAGYTDITKQLLKGRPALAYYVAENNSTPLIIAVFNNDLETIKLFLEHDANMPYVMDERVPAPILWAATQGWVAAAKMIISACPDSAYATNKNSANALHIAIQSEHQEFVDFILQTPQLHRLVNQPNKDGDLPLHLAAQLCNPEILRSLLSHKGQDYTAVSLKNFNAVDLTFGQDQKLKTLKWTESITLLLSVIPSDWRTSAADAAKRKIEKQAIQEVKSLTQRDTSNTSLVAALLATITFAAAFTPPGGFDNDPNSKTPGLPIFVKNAWFQVFMISDSIAMCSSLAVAFLCVLATWEDLDYLLNYRKTTRALMWCAYSATAVAFGTGLFTVVAPKSLWLATFILAICGILPFFSKIIGDLPKLLLCLRLRTQFRSDFLPNV
ncbi:ankyrin repeat family protein [Rhynchospora pubera]|uniref:Ankyrin repeat family protein n=1 Tax=Rhynchospora pubera TaxID=906938 RepID=A0AAV8D2U4_9POAL|nr:ankyrin repeat family protein [Rhynchospora pubera]